MHDNDLVAQGDRLVEIVGDHDDRRPRATQEIAEVPSELGAHDGIERPERLVEEHEAGIVHERADERDALPLAAGQLEGEPREERRIDASEAGKRREALFDLFRASTERAGTKHRVRAHVEVREEPSLLGDVADAAAHGVVACGDERLTEDLDAPPIGDDEPREQPEDGALPRAARAHHHDRLSRPRLDVDGAEDEIARQADDGLRELRRNDGSGHAPESTLSCRGGPRVSPAARGYRPRAVAVCSPGCAMANATPLKLEGRFSIDDVERLVDALRTYEGSLETRSDVVVDLEAVVALDATSIAVVAKHLRALARRGHEVRIEGGDPSLRDELTADVGRAPIEKPKDDGILADIGNGTLSLYATVKDIFAFVGEVVLSLFGVAKEPRTGNYRDVLRIAERAGADAVPIVLFINFLVGFVMGFQGAKQLKMFGANIFVADLVGLSVTRELGPLMTAIILAGRSGSAFAAELSTMKVSEEIDALRTMGFGPMRYLVFPRAFGLMLVAPILTLLADFVGILGGLAVGVAGLDLTVRGYLVETRQAVTAWDFNSGLVKSVAFALVIALVSCQQGFAAEGGAEGVGRKTTTSVVASLFALIVVDTLFTVFFRAFDL